MKLNLVNNVDISLYSQLGISSERAYEIGDAVRAIILRHIKNAAMPSGTGIVSNGAMLRDCMEVCNTLEEVVFCTNVHTRFMLRKPQTEDFTFKN